MARNWHQNLLKSLSSVMKLSNISNTIVQKDPTSSTKMLDTRRFALHAQYYKEKSPLSLNKSNLKNLSLFQITKCLLQSIANTSLSGNWQQLIQLRAKYTKDFPKLLNVLDEIKNMHNPKPSDPKLTAASGSCNIYFENNALIQLICLQVSMILNFSNMCS